jgi:hypothetical protein
VLATVRSSVCPVRDSTASPVRSPYLGVVGALCAGTAVGYVRLVGQQDDLAGLDARQSVVLAVLIGFAVVGAIGAFARPIEVRAALAAACAAGLLPLGFLALFSIGLILIVAGGCAVVAWASATSAAHGREAVVPSIAGAIASIAVVALAFVVTS